LLRAAILACGEGAVISHGTAAAFWGLRTQWPAVIDVIVPCEGGRKIDGIRARRCRYPGPEEIVERAGVRYTTPARTLVDLAGILGTPSLRRAVEEAAVRKLLDIPALDLAMDSAKGRRGVPALRAIVDEWRGPDGNAPDVRSIFEARVLPRLVAAGFEWPDCNRKLRVDGHDFIPDFYWEKRNLIVETDGEATHGTPPAFRNDRRRDQILIAAGFRVPRVTWSQMRDELEETIERLRCMLESGPVVP
jgi:hypothetical protein